MADRKDVEIGRVGTFDLQLGGTVQFTPAMLLDAARRAAEQGDKFRAALKLGHTDPRNDGEPAFGWLHNLRTTGAGDDTVLVGDITGMPQWLADTAPTAYPDRSLEGFAIGTDGLEVTALALLGVTPPGMTTLKSWRDLPQALAAASDLPLAAFAAAFSALSAIDDAPKLPAEPAESTPTTKEADTMSDTLLKGLRDRLGVSAETDEAGVLAALDAKLTTEPPTAVAPTVDSIAAAYKLTAEQVTTALAAAAAPITAPAGALPEGSVVVSKDALDELRIAAAHGVTARAKQLADERDETISVAIAAGKIAPARRQHWATNWDKDPEGAKASIAELENVYPVAASGHAGGGDGGSTDPITDDEAGFLASLTGAAKEAFLA